MLSLYELNFPPQRQHSIRFSQHKSFEKGDIIIKLSRDPAKPPD